MLEHECCELCRFWKRYTWPTGSATGYCKRNAPAISFPHFPATLESDWCGDFQAAKQEQAKELESKHA